MTRRSSSHKRRHGPNRTFQGLCTHETVKPRLGNSPLPAFSHASLTRRSAAVWDEFIVDDALETDTAMEGDLGKDGMRAGLPVLAFADAWAFDSWLESHGALAPGLRLRLAKKGAPERTLTKSEAIDAALCHGWIDGQLDTFDPQTAKQVVKA
jgi:hypothetical protein